NRLGEVKGATASLHEPDSGPRAGERLPRPGAGAPLSRPAERGTAAPVGARLRASEGSSTCGVLGIGPVTVRIKTTARKGRNNATHRKEGETCVRRAGTDRGSRGGRLRWRQLQLLVERLGHQLERLESGHDELVGQRLR